MSYLRCKRSALAVLLLSTVFACVSIPAFADYLGSPYISVHLGASKPTTKTYSDPLGSYRVKSDEGFIGDLAFGYQMDAFRTEIALGYTVNDAESITVMPGPIVAHDAGDTKSTTLMLNGYYHFMNRTGLTPYIGLGLGAARMQHKINAAGAMISASDTVFAYQGILGVACDISQNLRGSVDYRYLGTSRGDFDVSVGGVATGRYGSHRINFGLTFFM